ncbi:MAG: VanZ family protein [Filifactoraceae bacterium]
MNKQGWKEMSNRWEEDILLLQIIFLVLIYIFLYCKRWKNLEKNMLLINTLMYLYICFVLFLTILPIDFTFDPKWRYKIEYSYGNIKPFNDLLLGRRGSIKEVIFNIMMTVPFGFMYSFYNKDNGLKIIKVIKTTLVFSLAIEITQLIMTILLLEHRAFDVTDLITNTIGGGIGYLIYRKVINNIKYK